MKQVNINRRNAKIKEDWKNLKNDWSMEDLAEIYNLSLQSIYRILAGDKICPSKTKINQK
jgi:Mor family transcriptional regulator